MKFKGIEWEKIENQSEFLNNKEKDHIIICINNITKLYLRKRSKCGQELKK